MGNYGIFLMVGDAGFRSSSVVQLDAKLGLRAVRLEDPGYSVSYPKTLNPKPQTLNPKP